VYLLLAFDEPKSWQHQNSLFQSRSLCRNLQPLPVYFCCRPYSPGIALHLALFSQLQAPTDCEGLLKCLSSGWVLPTRNFPSSRFFLGWCNLVFSLRPGFYWTLLKRLFEFEAPGAQRVNKETFLPFLGTSWLGGVPIIFQFVCDWVFIWYLASRNKALDAALTVGMPCEHPTWPNIRQTFLLGLSGVWMRCIMLQLPLPSAPSFSDQVAWMF
jgi:hypothetical protein